MRTLRTSFILAHVHSSAVEAVNKLTLEHYTRNHPDLVESSPESKQESSPSVSQPVDTTVELLIPEFLFQENGTDSKVVHTVVQQENVCYCSLQLNIEEETSQSTETVDLDHANSIQADSTTRRPISHDVIKKAQKEDDILSGRSSESLWRDH